MSHTIDFLEEIAERNNIRPTAYAIAKHMAGRYGWSRQSVQNYRRGMTVPSDRHALDIANELGLEPMFVVARINEDRESDPQLKKIWQQIAEATRSAAAAVILAAAGVVGIGHSDDAVAAVERSADQVRGGVVYYVKYKNGIQPDAAREHRQEPAEPCRPGALPRSSRIPP